MVVERSPDMNIPLQVDPGSCVLRGELQTASFSDQHQVEQRPPFSPSPVVETTSTSPSSSTTTTTTPLPQKKSQVSTYHVIEVRRKAQNRIVIPDERMLSANRRVETARQPRDYGRSAGKYDEMSLHFLPRLRAG